MDLERDELRDWASHLERAQIAALVAEAREINDGLRALFLNIGARSSRNGGRNHSVTGGDIIQEFGWRLPQEAARCDLFSNIRNKLGVLARGKRLPSTFVWSREINPDGTGEHMHVLLHMPSRHRSKFDELVTGWLPGPTEAGVTTAHQKTRLNEAASAA